MLKKVVSIFDWPEVGTIHLSFPVAIHSVLVWRMADCSGGSWLLLLSATLGIAASCQMWHLQREIPKVERVRRDSRSELNEPLAVFFFFFFWYHSDLSEAKILLRSCTRITENSAALGDELPWVKKSLCALIYTTPGLDDKTQKLSKNNEKAGQWEC